MFSVEKTTVKAATLVGCPQRYRDQFAVVGADGQQIGRNFFSAADAGEFVECLTDAKSRGEEYFQDFVA